MKYGEVVYACALSRIFYFHCDKAKQLIELVPTPSAIFSLSRRELEDMFGKHSHFPDDILNPYYLEQSAGEVQWAEKYGVKILYIKDADYPVRLRECVDAPIIIYYKGNCDLNPRRIVSIVGTRRVTPYGVNQCRAIIKQFANLDIPPIIVSGLAYGVDICAHNTALEYGIPTIGIMATGLDTIYPTAHRGAAARMLNCGGIISDFPRATSPEKLNFIRRNRIIAGISDATILIESEEKGGGMITAKMAYSYFREVFAVPGRVNDRYSVGCNLLIKDNIANIISEKVSSVISVLGWDSSPTIQTNPPGTLFFESDGDIKRKILVALSSDSSKDIGAIIESLAADYRDVIQNITELELEGRIWTDTNGRFFVK